MVYRGVLGMLFALLLIPSVTRGAPSPRGEIETFFERAKGILRQATDINEARTEFRALTRTLFDGRAAARQALGPEWKSRPNAAREQFAGVFSEVLQRAYLEIVQGQLPRQREPSIRVLGEEVDGHHAVVRTSATARDGRDVRMDYAMDRTGDRWRVHDVAIDGVSLVDNYGAQFARVLRTAAFSELVDRLRVIVGTEAGGLTAIEADAPAETVIYFAANRADVPAGTHRELEEFAAKATNGQRRVVVEGHADARGDARSNESLAQRRALAIRDYLVTRGVAADRIVVVAQGDRRPVCRDQAERCWDLNRRASIQLIP
jgi:outer membrane protein OmpA-like peptidoglycan-associated protein